MAQKHSKYEVELLKLYSETDERGRRFMLDLLVCFTTFGKPFTDEMQTYLDAKDKEAMFACVDRWIATIGEGATV